ncbi:Fc.00g047440.m01.CDS01 [Cosmosporella sp. VM-42]
MASAIYNKLSPEQHDIRLLVLEAAQESTDPLKARLMPASLDDNPEYNALSYVWGGPEKPSRLEISFKNSHTEVAITKNLQLALERLRPVNNSLTIWIDAVCINQNDISERNCQVAMMGLIYRSATRVVAFFHEGAGNEDITAHAIDFIQAVSAQPTHHLMPTLDPHIDESLQNKDSGVGALLMFFKTDWWHRVWTVQEAILAVSLRIVYGSRELEFSDLLLFCNAFQRHVHSCCREFNPIPGVVVVSSIERLLSIAQDLGQYQSMHTSGSLDYLDIVGNFRYRKATDMRDKIYGLTALSMLPAGFVDYGLSLHEVYVRHAIITIQYAKNLDIWSHLFTLNVGRIHVNGHVMRSKRLENLPSWTPDWSLEFGTAASDILKLRHQFIIAFKASGETKISMEHLALDKLRLRGVIFDRVQKVGAPNLQPNVFLTNLVDDWEEVAGIGESNTPETAHVKYSSIYQEFRRAITWDLGSSSSFDMLSEPTDARSGEPIRRTDDCRDRFLYELWRHHKPCITEEDYEANMALIQSISQLELDQFRGMVMTMTLGKRFIVTQSGLLGFGPAEAEVGDAVCCFYGGRTPYIIRCSPLSVSRILGDAYIQGAMDGSVMELAEHHPSHLVPSDIILE